MSAYVVEDETINRIVAWLQNEAASGGQDNGLGALALAGHGLRCAMSHEPPALAEACERLGRALHFLNVGAVRDRYEDADKANMIGDGYAWRQESPAGLIQTYKSLRCWLYECSEGKVPDSPLFQAMQRVADALANQIVIHLPSYSAAKWG